MPSPLFNYQSQIPSQEELSSQNANHLLDMLSVLENIGSFEAKPAPKYDYLRRAKQYARKTDNLRAKIASQRAENRNVRLANSPNTYSPVNFNLGGGGGGGGKFQRFMRAISGQESGGNYGIVNKDSGALGKYQIMPANLQGSSGWDRQYTGRDVTPQFFLSHPKYQEKLARAVLRNYVNKYGVRGAASAWYSGSPTRWNERTPQGGYPSVHQYVLDILRRM